MSDEATKAFLSSAGFTFQGERYQPFTPQRMALAAELGMVWPNNRAKDRAVTEIEIETTEGKGKKAKSVRRKIDVVHYRQSFRDRIIFLFLCSLLEKDLDTMEGDVGDETALKAWKEKMWEWARQKAILQNNEAGAEALGLWIRATNELAQSKAEPIPKHDVADEGESPGEL